MTRTTSDNQQGNGLQTHQVPTPVALVRDDDRHHLSSESGRRLDQVRVFLSLYTDAEL